MKNGTTTVLGMVLGILGLALLGGLAPQGVALAAAALWLTAYLWALMGPRGALAGVAASLVHTLALASPLGTWGYQVGAALGFPLLGLVGGLALSLGLGLALGLALILWRK